MLKKTQAALERKDHIRVIELCDQLLAEFSYLISVPVVKEKRAVALCEVGQFSEAQPVFRQFLESHRELGMPIASSTWMYHWLVCYYRGDSRKAMDQFVALDELRAVALLNEGNEPEPTRMTEPVEPVDNAFESTDLARHVEELGKTDVPCWGSYSAIEAAGACAVPHLLPLISADDYFLRARSIDLLGKVGDARALDPLKKAAVISEREFRTMISASPEASTVKMDGLDIPVQDMLAEYRRWAKDAYEAVSARLGV
jgi:hypothetical protein